MSGLLMRGMLVASLAGLTVAAHAQAGDLTVFDGATLTGVRVGGDAYESRSVPVYSNGRFPGTNLTFFGGGYDVLDEVDFTGGIWDGVANRMITEMRFGLAQFSSGSEADVRYEFYRASDLDGSGPFGTAYTRADMLGSAMPFFTQTFQLGSSTSGFYSWFTEPVSIHVPDGVNRLYVRFSVLNPGTTNLWTGPANAWVPGFSNDMTVGGGLTNFAINTFNSTATPAFTGNPNPGRGEGCTNPAGETQEHLNWAFPPACRTLDATNGKGMYLVLGADQRCPLVVVSQPTSQQICEGLPVSFSASFSGSILSRQWRKYGIDIPGAVGSTFIINASRLEDAGLYDCVATNDCGDSVTSEAATLDVTPWFAIASQPVDQQAEVGSSVSFFVEVRPIDGCTTPVTYQWQRRNPAVTDPEAPNAWIDLAESATFLNPRSSGLIITRSIPALATGFRCRIGGGCGCDPGDFIYTNTVNFSVACPADFNADGGVDFGDIEAFFERWENGC